LNPDSFRLVRADDPTAVNGTRRPSADSWSLISSSRLCPRHTRRRRARLSGSMRSCAMWTQGDRDEPFHTLLVCCPTYPMGEQLNSGFAAVDTPSAAGHTSLVLTAAREAENTPDRVPKPRAAGSTPAGATISETLGTQRSASSLTGLRAGGGVSLQGCSGDSGQYRLAVSELRGTHP
jgi:hypothetical protein